MLFFVPGFMLDPDFWRDIEGDLQAFGLISHANMGDDGSIETLAERALADAWPCFIVIGLSLGGYVAREMVRRARETRASTDSDFDIRPRRWGKPKILQGSGCRALQI